jgi:glycosyltransferase involved in cell wall biosynthesis
MYKVSVVIPVYNAENHLEQCIQSLISQTLHKCEYIFVNDGSFDKSKEIIEKYIKIDSRIKLINQKNQGVSSARNNGLGIATGKYIGFVDADDWIEKDMYEVLYKAAESSDCDVIISNISSEVNGNIITHKYPFKINSMLNKEDIESKLLTYLLKNDDFNSVVTKLYKRKTIQDFNICFPIKKHLGEDGIFNITFLSKAQSALYIDYSGYLYRDVDDSATRNIAKNDYFGRSLEVYNLNYPAAYFSKIDINKLQSLKSIKLVRNVMSYIHLYLEPSNSLSFFRRYQYVKNMIRHHDVRKALNLYLQENETLLNSYEKFLIKMIQVKSVSGLLLATSYIRHRNNKRGA